MTTSASLPFQLTKTLLCAYYELQAMSKVDVNYFLNCTLNQKYNVLPSTLPVNIPKMQYFGIGIRGVKNLDDENLQAPYVPSPANLDLYSPIPFRIVPIENDLTETEREDYRMRVLKTVDGEQYWCYYLKKLSFINNSVNIVETDLTTNEESILDGLDATNLTPTPTVTNAEDTVETTKKINSVVTAGFSITGEEVIEAINVLYSGNLLRAVPSEIGIYCGDEQTITMADGLGGTFEGKESALTTLCYHYCRIAQAIATESQVENSTFRLASANAYLL